MSRQFLLSARQGRAAFWWMAVFFAASQGALFLYLEQHQPEVKDPVYAIRLRSLRGRLARSPDSPLVLVLGSSRIKYGLWPAAMPAQLKRDGSAPVVYNFGVNGAGHIRELMYFRRLLEDGIRPDWLVLETWPPLWPEEGYFAERRMVANEDNLHVHDVPLVCRYFHREPDVLAWAASQLLPLYLHRSRLLGVAAPYLLPWSLRKELPAYQKDWDPEDDTGWFPLPYGPVTAEQKERVVERNMVEIGPYLQRARIDPRSDSALRTLLVECRSRGIGTVLLIMPEHTAARATYSPAARVVVQNYLTGLQRSHPVPVIDARAWLADDFFADATHLWPRGAMQFSARFGREVLEPLLNHEPLDPGVCLSSSETP
jgi:hypothetical protein